MDFAAGSIGVLGFFIWPTYAGVLLPSGVEPLGDPDYKRGQINWAVGEDDVILGNVKILVPRGEWSRIVYMHQPLTPGFVTLQHLSHPLLMRQPGDIEILGITEADIRQQSPKSIYSNTIRGG
jgi:hypothetical protein